MRELCSSSDLREHTELVKRLLDRGIPCAVFKQPVNSRLTVWIQHDSNYPQAVNVFADQNRARPLAPWVSVLEKFLAESDESGK
jgi:hypothetical protein